MHNCFVVYQFLKVILIKNYKDTATNSYLPVHIYQFISCFMSALTSADIILYNFLNLHQPYLKNIFPTPLTNKFLQNIKGFTAIIYLVLFQYHENIVSSLDLHWFWYQNIKLEGHCQVILIWLAGQFQSHVGWEMSGMSL